MNTGFIKNTKAYARLMDGTSVRDIIIEEAWDGDLLHSVVRNKSEKPYNVKEVVLFAGEIPFSEDTPFYAESYNMISQYRGTLASPRCIGSYGTDWEFLRLPRPEWAKDLWSTYNLLLLMPDSGENLLMAFTSTNRFGGEFRFKGSYLEIIMDMEGLELEPGEAWQMEEFMVAAGERNELMKHLADRLCLNHPLLRNVEIPYGWCSWYCYFNDIDEEKIRKNAAAVAKKLPEFKYIQIDDGYQTHYGDWLDIKRSFIPDIKGLFGYIQEKGLVPAIWVAPFIADKDSMILKEHPDWFVTDNEGKPWNDVGWVPEWYMLDGTNPAVQRHFAGIVKTMHDDWGCRYFKLDFLIYGALPGGCRYDKKATKIEAYRRGLKAIVDAVGEDSFILGCNISVWPTLGLVNGTRLSNDIFREWKYVSGIAEEMFLRNWQNNRLWINDPDCTILENLEPNPEKPYTMSKLTDDEFSFHIAFIYATGGMVMSGDEMTSLSQKSIEIIRKLIPPAGIPAEFDDLTFTVGRIRLSDRQMVCVFNWENEARDIPVPLQGRFSVQDYITNKGIGTYEGELTIVSMPPHSGRILCMQAINN